MKTILRYSSLLFITLFYFWACDKEQQEVSPIQISHQVTSVSKYGQKDGSITLTVSGGIAPYSYLWSNNKTTKDIDSLSAGIYVVTVSDESKQSETDNIEVTQPLPDSLKLKFISTNVSVYNGKDGAIGLFVQGGVPPYQFNWSNGANTKDLQDLVSGTYSVRVSDAQNSFITDSIEITQPNPEAIVLTIVSQNITVYNGNNGSIEISVSGGVPPYLFQWSNGETTQNLSNLSAGDYSLTVSDAVDSVRIENIILTQPAPVSMSVVLEGHDVTTFNGHDGTISLSVSGGIEPYTFVWSNGATTQNLSNLLAGEYTVKVTDALNDTCSGSILIHQPEPDELIVTYTKTDVTTYGGNDGSIGITIEGGVSPYAVLWSNGETTESINMLISNTYTVTITDSNNSLVNYEITISQPVPEPLNVDLFKSDVTVFNGNDGYIELTVSGGVAPYSFQWSNGETTQNISNLSVGEYSVLVTDNIGTSQTVVSTLVQPEQEGTVKDIDGNIYHIIVLGNQTWMQENLRVTHAPDGLVIPSYCFNNNVEYAETYGRLYSWDVAMNYSTKEKAQGICPDGWHIPSDEEWKELEIYLGMTEQEANMSNTWRGTGVGTALKKNGSSGYEALLSGRRSSSGSYSLFNRFEYIWTSSEYGSNAWRRCLDSESTQVGRWNTFPKTYGFSIRCIKDD